MKRKLIALPALGLLAAAIATALPIRTAYAAPSGSIWIGDVLFANWIAAAVAGTPSPYENGQFQKLNLSVIGDTLWVPKAGSAHSQPIDDPALQEAVRRQEADERLLRQRLGPVGGVNTF